MAVRLHQLRDMRKINVLLANTERRFGNVVEAMILDVCFEQATVEFTRVSKAAELARLGRYEEFDLIIVSPNHLLPGRPGSDARPLLEEVRDGVLAIREVCETPIIAVGVAEEDNFTLLEAGVTQVFETRYDAECLRPEVQRALELAEPVGALEVEESRWSLGSVFSRGLGFLKSA